MTTLTFDMPLHIIEHFEVPVDTAPWDGGYTRGTGGNHPVRSRAPFHSWGNALTPISDIAANLEQCFGVYILAFGHPKDGPPPALYIGVAGNGGRTPEGVLRRLRKHRVKVTASQVGPAGSVGGVNHTLGWRTYAAKRHSWFAERNSADDLSDARWVVGQLDSSKAPVKTLEFFEHALFTNHLGMRDALVALLWPNSNVVPHLLTTRTSKGTRPERPILRWWDGSTHHL